MATLLLDVSLEILELILTHYYGSWSISVLDRVHQGCLPIAGVPPSHLLRTCHYLAETASRVELRCFSRQLIFATASTQWRTLARMRDISDRLKYYLDHVNVIRFCSPPLFTSRIPWTELPALRRVDLDYCSRKANFRCQGSLEELMAGQLDPTIVSFARDSERFDVPLVEDAGAREPRIRVNVIKKMLVSEGVPVPPTFMVPGQPVRSIYELIITARHDLELEEITFECSNFKTKGRVLLQEATVWKKDTGFRDTGQLDGTSKLPIVTSVLAW